MLNRLIFSRGGRSRVENAVSGLLAQGVAHYREERLTDAERCFLEALSRDPRSPDTLNLLGVVFHARLDYETALDYYESALRLAPGNAILHENHGLALADLGRLDDARAAFCRSLELDPNYARCGRNLLFLERVHPSVDEVECFRAHRAWAARYAECRPWLAPVTGRSLDPERRLRLAYLSGDFFSHAVSVFLDPLFAYRDRTAFELFCYRTVREDDKVTEQYRSLADHWHDVFELSDDELTELIRSHEIDILVDLAGITKGERARVVGRKPAPVQISYLGYLGSTGMTAIDYRVTDALADPPGHSERFHTERLLRLPSTQWAYTPDPRMPELLPVSDSGPVVFGSFHRLAKLHAGQLVLWAELLARVPNSRLEILDIPSEGIRDRVLAPFLARGIASQRIVTHSRLDRVQYWDFIRRTHIGLDAYPYNGAASTCDVLWMGVPVVTRAGRHGFSRSGASILGALDLSHLVAASEAEFLAIAAGLAADRTKLAALSSSLRDRMRASPLINARGFMRELEDAYRSAWRTYCSGAE